MADTKFSDALETFVAGCTRIAAKNSTKFSVTVGRRYAKVVADGGSVHCSVHCFVDRDNGDVLKAASWSAPAKHARGNIFDESNGLRLMGPYGPAYLRG